MKVTKLDDGSFRITAEYRGERLTRGRTEMAVAQYLMGEADTAMSTARCLPRRAERELAIAKAAQVEAERYINLANTFSPAAERHERHDRATATIAKPAVRTVAPKQLAVTGYASVWYSPGNPGTQFRLREDYIERVMPGAYNAFLRTQPDVPLLVNHHADNAVARTPSLRLSADNHGLRIESDLANTNLGRDLYELVRTRTIRGMSIAFGATQVRLAREGSTTIRNLEGIELIEVSAVLFPAFTATSINVA